MSDAADSSTPEISATGEEGWFVSWHDSQYLPSKPLSLVLTVLYAVMALSLYGGPYLGRGEDVAAFFGIEPSLHLMKSCGLLMILMTMLNLATAAKVSRGVTVFSFFANIVTFVHYSVETFWFRELYLSVMIPICLVVVVQVVNSVLLERKSIKMRKLREANSSEKLD